jgi:hypothetical protein
MFPRWQQIGLTALLAVGLGASLFWNPPFPFPFENNYAMVDFVQLQKVAAEFLEDRLSTARVATAWPYTAALRRPAYGYVSRPLKVVETGDFKAGSVQSIAPSRYDALVVYTRTWVPPNGVIRWQWVRTILSRFYDYQPEIDYRQCAALGLRPAASWERRGQTITIYVRR